MTISSALCFHGRVQKMISMKGSTANPASLLPQDHHRDKNVTATKNQLGLKSS